MSTFVHCMKHFPRKLAIVLIATAALLLVYMAAGFLLVPTVLKNLAVQELMSFLGRNVTVRSIAFNPYTMSVTVLGVRVDEPAGGAIFSADSVRASFAPLSSLFHRTWAFREATVSAPSVIVSRNSRGELNLADLLQLDWPKNINVSLALFRLSKGNALFNDESVPGGFSARVNNLEATVMDFSTIAGHPCSFSISAASDAGERFSLNGVLRVHPLSSRGEMAAENIPLPRYGRYLPHRLAFTITDGILSMHAAYEVDFSPEHFTLLLRKGSITAQSVAVCEQGTTAPLLGFQKLILKDAQLDMVKQTIGIGSISVNGGSVFFRRLADSSFNVQHLLGPGRSPPAVSPAPAAPWHMSIGEIRLADFTAQVSRILGLQTMSAKELLLSLPAFQTSPFTASLSGIALRGGTLLFRDPSLSPPVEMALTRVNIRVGGFSSANRKPASVAVKADIGDRAQLQISGNANPLAPRGETNLRALLRNMSLLPFGPYAAKYLGYELTSGELNLDVSLLIRGQRLNSRTTIEIDTLSLGEKTESAEATKLPVRLAIFLLTDSSGNIKLNIPIDTGLSAAAGALQKQLTDAVLTPFQKAASFPFSTFDVSSASSGEELGVQDFAHGSAVLLEAQSERLDRIREGLRRWPELMVDIEGSIDPDSDTGDLQPLAANRAQAVREYLLRTGTLEPTRVFLLNDSLENIPRKGSKALLTLKDRYRHTE
jgi:hypothetical protein